MLTSTHFITIKFGIMIFWSYLKHFVLKTCGEKIFFNILQVSLCFPSSQLSSGYFAERARFYCQGLELLVDAFGHILTWDVPSTASCPLQPSQETLGEGGVCNREGGWMIVWASRGSRLI